MALGFSTGMMDRVANFGKARPEEPAGMMGSNDPLARALGGVVGTDMRTAPERSNQALNQIQNKQSQEGIMQALLVQAQYEQDPQKKIAYFMKAQEVKADMVSQQKAMVTVAAQQKSWAVTADLVKSVLPELVPAIQQGDPEALKVAYAYVSQNEIDQWSSVGNNLFNRRTGEFKLLVDEKSEENGAGGTTVAQKQSLIKIARAKFPPGDVQDSIIDGILSGLYPDLKSFEKLFRGDTKMGAPTAKALEESNQRGTKASAGMAEARNVLNRIDILEKSPEWSGAGLWAKAETATKNALGLGDQETWIRIYANEAINNALVQGLPKGVASDKDIELIQAGFPNPDNVTMDQLKEYMQARERLESLILDRSLLFDRHIEKQEEANKGSVTSAGFLQKEIAFFLAASKLQQFMDNAPTTEAQDKYLQDFEDSFGIIPSIYTQNGY